LADLFSQNDNLLILINKLIEAVRFSNPEFYAVYKNSRKLYDTGIQKLKVKVRVSDAADSSPIRNVELKFVPINPVDTKTMLSDTKPVFHKTAVHGGVNVKHLPEGVYNLTLIKNGYKPQNIVINVTHGELTKLDIVMEKVA
jgi:hypothetical protein